MKSKLFLFLVLIFVGSNLNAQKDKSGFKLEVNAPQHKDKIAYILRYWNESTYIQDSCFLSTKGFGTFHAKEALPTGQYVLYIKPDIQLELLLDKEQNNIKISVSKDIVNSKISGNKDSEVLWDYIKNVNNHTTTQSNLYANKDVKTMSQSELDKINKQSEELNQQLNAYNQKLIDDNKGRWVSDFLKGMSPILPPNRQPTTKEEKDANRVYMKKHYFDNISLTDPRMLRTNYFQSSIDNYMENWVEQDADSLAFAASRLVAMTEGNKYCFDQMLMKHINNAINSNRMGMENTWSKLAEEYIFDKNIVEIDSTEVKNLNSKYQLIKSNRIGMIAHDLQLQKINGDTIRIHDIDAEYTILYFYDPNCGHCKTETTNIQEKLYPVYKDRGLKIVTINVQPEPKSWISYIEKQNISDWINCADPQYKSQFWMYYNTSAVPAVYLLDKNKKIIAKDINEQSLELILNHLYKEDGTNKGS